MKTTVLFTFSQMFGKLKKYLIALTVSFFLLSFLLMLSVANWEDLEELLLSITFDDFASQQLYSIQILEEEEDEFEIKEIIDNPTFSFGLEGWDAIGHVETSAGFDSYAQLGFNGSSNLIQENCISQDIQTENAVQLLIDYQWYSSEDLTGFDQISLAVLLDDRLLHLESSLQAEKELRQELILNLPANDSESSKLKICAGNTGDRSASSWLKLFKISSLVVAINNSQQLKIKAENSVIKASYQVDDQIIENFAQDALTVTFDSLIADNKLHIEIEHQDKQLITRTVIPTYVHTQPPANPSEAMICATGENQYVLSIDYPENIDLLTWQLEYSPIENNDLPSEQRYQAIRYFPDWPLSLVPPVCSNERCVLYFHLDQEAEIDSEQNLAFYIRGCDVTGLCSDFVEATDLDDCREFFDDGQEDQMPILINEIMFNPFGVDTGDYYEGEWVELFNPNNFELDLSNWRIEDEAGWVISLDSDSCDSNHDITDSGETIIPANGFLIAFTRGRAIFNNTGDSAYLYDADSQLIDEVSHPGSSVENKTYGRFPDGIDQWFPRMISTPLAPNQID
ncbi:MAG: hypothetical protein XD95_0040 [Microgenomates bacterium 39_7]|nr:MAG: hypothetical protein XD95_0040 [Microgenomates bacterium 39_7]